MYKYRQCYPCIVIIMTKTTILTHITNGFIIIITNALCVQPELIKRHDCMSAQESVWGIHCCT